MKAATTETTPSRGRPRDPRCDAAIIDAALALVAEQGYERTSLEAIATRAGVSKPTIYRRWSGKQELVVDAIRTRRTEKTASWDTGSLRGDLLAAADECARGMAEDTQLAAGLAIAARESRELADLIRKHVIEDDRRRWMDIVERAVARGELPSDPPVTHLLPDVAPSLVFTRLLLMREPVDRDFAEELVDRILTPILSPTT